VKYDLHVHTTASDGTASPEKMVRAAVRAGLTGIAITDHNTTAGVAAARAAAPPGFLVITGAEYTTDMGHILALFIENCAAAAGLGRDSLGRFSLAQLAPFVRAQGGLLIAAHPVKKADEPPEDLYGLIDGLEALNALEESRKPGSRGLVERIALSRGLFLTGGSDAHTPLSVGRAYTLIDGGPYATLSAGACLPAGRALGRGMYVLEKLRIKAARR
jgi:predicted metal-dependent phosphoesterase TrpH